MADDSKLGGNIGMPAPGPGQNRVPDVPTSTDREDSATQAAEDRRILARAKKRFDFCVSAEADNRRAGASDDEFYAGNQWDSDLRAQRTTGPNQRPTLTLNKLPTLVRQVTNDQRQNRPAPNISPVGDRGDPEAAKILAGLVRFIERDCDAETAYDTGFESASRKGWGYWRLLTEFEPGASFDQRIVISAIPDAFAVYMRPCADPTGRGVPYAFITEEMSREDFEDEYPDADPMPWDRAGQGDTKSEWIAKDKIRVAEYFEIETGTRTVAMLDNGHVGWKDELAKSALRKITAEREAEVKTVHWYKITAVDVLDRRVLPGQSIPIVRVIGDEIVLSGKHLYSGLVRHAKDAQRMYNYWRSKETEAIALAPNAPWVVAEGQIEGHEDEWATAHTRARPVLEYNPVSLEGHPVPPPQRQAPVQIPAAFVNAAQEAAQDMMATTGVRFDATPQERMYDESGRALRELRRSGDIGSFHLVDNLAKALRRTGEIMLEWIPEIYDSKRIMTILREDGAEEPLLIDPSAARAADEARVPDRSKPIKVLNPTIGRYGVTVTVGPSYATKRIEAAESMMDFVRALGPQVGQMVADLIAKNQDWPGATEIADRLAKALPPNLLTPDQKDIPPQVQALVQAMQQQLQQAAQERAQLMQALTEKQSAMALQQDKQEKDFEAKLMAIVQKADAVYGQHVGSQLKDLAEGVRQLSEMMRGGGAPGAGGSREGANV